MKVFYQGKLPEYATTFVDWIVLVVSSSSFPDAEECI